MCNGCLVLHRDGEVAYCSEELDGGTCSGYDVPHLAGIMACRVTPRGTRCRHCDEVMRNRLKAYMTPQLCDVCNGKRLKPEILAVTLGSTGLRPVVSGVSPETDRTHRFF